MRSSFSQAFRFYEKNISLLLKQNEINKEPIFIWNNISKLGLSEGKTGVNDKSRELERKYFNVVKGEFDIIKPDLVIFMTGPTRDNDIKFNFEQVLFSKVSDFFSQRKMALVEIDGIKGLRLYHPAYFSGFNKKYKKETLTILNKILQN